MAKITGPLVRLRSLALLINKADARPAMGVKVGGGIHIVIPATYTQGAPGWLQRVIEIAGEVQYDAARLTALPTSPLLTVPERAQTNVDIAALTVTGV